MPSIDDIAAAYVERAAALDPCYATYAGIGGHDHEPADLGADGFAGRAGLDRSTSRPLTRPQPRSRARRSRGPRCGSGWHWLWSATTPGTLPANSAPSAAGCR